MGTHTLWALGPKGTNGHEAAMGFLDRRPDFSQESIRFADRHHEIFSRVGERKNDCGIVPIENTSAGLVGDVIRSWLPIERQDSLPVNIVAEYWMPIRHHLLAPRQVKDSSDLSVVFSHGQALAQCEERLLALNVPTQVVQSTAHAARQVAEAASRGKDAFGALASDFAGWTYGLHALEHDLQGAETNATRFLLLSQKPAKPTGTDKTAVLVRLKHRPGALNALIHPIADHGANMTSIHSIPLGRRETFAFYLEFSGHKQDRPTRRLLDILRARTERLIILGSFPVLTTSN